MCEVYIHLSGNARTFPASSSSDTFMLVAANKDDQNSVFGIVRVLR